MWKKKKFKSLCVNFRRNQQIVKIIKFSNFIYTSRWPVQCTGNLLIMKKKNPTMKEEFKLSFMQCCWQCQIALKINL